jgi:hypothetical protein
VAFENPPVDVQVPIAGGGVAFTIVGLGRHKPVDFRPLAATLEQVCARRKRRLGASAFGVMRTDPRAARCSPRGFPLRAEFG